MSSEKRRIFFDNAATTPLLHTALDAMRPFFGDAFHNPSSLSTPAQGVRQAVTDARRTIARAINAAPGEVFFTSGGTESINWALKGVMCGFGVGAGHVITSAIEHHAVIETCKHLEACGCRVTYLPVDSFGYVQPKAVRDAICDDTRLISLSMANNEVGTIQPLGKIAEIARAREVLLHTDAVQAVGHIPVDVAALGVDMLSLSGHKFYGPKGAGALYVRKGTNIAPLFHGGAQENKHRAGTENVIGIVGMAAALAECVRTSEHTMKRVSQLRNLLIHKIFYAIPHVVLIGASLYATQVNGLANDRLPGNVNICFKFVEGEAIMQNLDIKGFCVSTGSACASGSLEPSHVLVALGLDPGDRNSCVRFSLGRFTTEDEVSWLVDELADIVARLRELSPLYEDFLAERGSDSGV